MFWKKIVKIGNDIQVRNVIHDVPLEKNVHFVNNEFVSRGYSAQNDYSHNSLIAKKNVSRSCDIIKGSLISAKRAYFPFYD